MHARDPARRRLFLASVVSGAEVAEAVGLRMPQPPQNVLSPADVRALAALADFEPVKSEMRLLLPVRLFGLGRLRQPVRGAAGRSSASLCLRHYTVLPLAAARRRRRHVGDGGGSGAQRARQYRGGGAAACRASPTHIEIIFVEGHSKDGTWEEIERVVAAYPQYDIKAMRQPGQGQGATRCSPLSTRRAATS